MGNVFFAVMWFLIIGAFFGLILAFAAKLFAVKVDEREEAIAEILPKANCGGCGYAGCTALAGAIVKGNAEISACPVGGPSCASKIAEIMGESAGDDLRHRAFVMCSGTNDLAKKKYRYLGIHDCISANRLSGGSKTCPNGCLGFGTCVKNCKFDAITIVNGVAAVDYDKCTACSACISACPKNIIKLIPFNSTHWVGCMSSDKGAVTRTYCDVGCIACKLCEKKCEHDAVKVNDFVASIDQTKCVGCGECEKICPRKIIWSDESQETDGIVRRKGQVDSSAE